MTRLGVVRVALANTSRITMASASIRYINRQLLVSSFIRSSWHRAPTDGIGREAGNPMDSPCCKRRRRNPVSRRAWRDKGGDLTSPCNQARGLSFGLTGGSICQNGHTSKSRRTTACSELGQHKMHAPDCPADAELSDCALRLRRPVADAGRSASLTMEACS
jgi:hypothetical protein